MTLPRCATCAHWSEVEANYSKAGVSMRQCTLLSHDNSPLVDTEWEEEMGWASGADVDTAETFGCVLHEERKP